MDPSKLFSKHPRFCSLPLQPVIGAKTFNSSQMVILVFAKMSLIHADNLAKMVKMRGKCSGWQQACLSLLLYLSISLASWGSGRRLTQTPRDCNTSPKSIGRRSTTGCSRFKSGFNKLVTGAIRPNAPLLAFYI